MMEVILQIVIIIQTDFVEATQLPLSKDIVFKKVKHLEVEKCFKFYC